MTKVTGPMHSDDASGLYGGTKTGVIFSGWRGVRYTREYAVPAQPRTVAQLRNRAIVRCLNALWTGFTELEKGYWTTYGAIYDLPGYQAFCKYNLLQAQQGWMPQPTVSLEHLGTPDAPTNLAAAVVDSNLVTTWTDDTLAFTTGVHLGTGSGFTPSLANLAYATPATDGEDRQATIVVAAGTYYVRARSGDSDGGVGAPTAAVGPFVVT